MNQIDVSTAELIGSSHNEKPGRKAATRISLFYKPEPATGKAFVAQVEMRYEGVTTNTMQVHLGDLDRAMSFFKPSALTDELKLIADDWWDMNEHRIDLDLRQDIAPWLDSQRGLAPGGDLPDILEIIAPTETELRHVIAGDTAQVNLSLSGNVIDADRLNEIIKDIGGRVQFAGMAFRMAGIEANWPATFVTINATGIQPQS